MAYLKLISSGNNHNPCHRDGYPKIIFHAMLIIVYLGKKMHGFLPEVKYNGGINAIAKFTSFTTYTKLEPYIDKIDISNIMGM
jgi:hypothetical protein